MVKERIRKRVVVAQVEALSPEFDFRDWWKPRKIWLWTACLRLWTRGFLNMERHVRLAAGCLNSYEHILKTAKWNLRLGGTTQSTHVDSYFHTKRRTKGRFCFSQISDVLPGPIFFFCKRSTQICDKVSFCLAGASGQQLFYSVCVFMCQPGVTWGGERRMDRHILIAIRPT